MAEKVIKKVEDQLNCSICLDTYTNPKLLQCFHVYCQDCLVRLVVRDQQGQLSLTCPNCRQVTPVPAKGVSGLQAAFHINPLLEIVDELRKEKDAPANAERQESSSASFTSHKVTPCCSEHDEEELKLYCETCDELICFHCTMKVSKHHNHDYQLLGEAFEKYKKEVGSSMEPMEKQLATIDKTLSKLDTRRGEASDQQAAIEANIHDTFRRIQQVLDVRKTEVIHRSHIMTQGKLKHLAAQMDQVETIQAQLHSCLDFMRESIKTESQSDVLKMKPSLFKQVKELTTTFQPDLLEPNTEADMKFSASADITAMCLNYGDVSASGSPDPSKCHVTGKGLEVANLEDKSTVDLQVINCRGEPSRKPIKSLEFLSC